VTVHPSAEWIARQLTEFSDGNEPPQYIFCDSDTAYGSAFIRRIGPWASGSADFGSVTMAEWIRRKAHRFYPSSCLDHVVVFGEQHLRHLLSCYQRYYNEVRQQLALKDAPISGDFQSGPSAGRQGHCLGVQLRRS
jgi:hypothetical protein